MSPLERILEPEVMDTPEDAADYDAMDNTAPNDAFVERLLELGPTHPTGKMLDIGTGPGHIPLLLAEHFPTNPILGVDLSDEMLKIANRKLEDFSKPNNITFKRVDAKALPFQDDFFGTVFSNTILHHIPNPKIFLEEAWRVLKPNGTLLIRDLYRPQNMDELNHLVEMHAGDCNDDQKKMFAESLHAALTPDELRALVKEVGMTNIEVVVDTDRHMSLQTRR